MEKGLYFDSVGRIPDPDRYLERIGYTGKIEVNKRCLDELIVAHHYTVPFENLDVCDLNRPIVLTPEHLYEKIVLHNRGGYCFEMNGAFLFLLKALGFVVTPAYCRVARADALSPILHRGVLIYLDDRTYFCDVGFGGVMSPEALVMEDGYSITAGPERFTIKHYDGTWFELIGDSPYRVNRDGKLERMEKTDLLISKELGFCGDFDMFNDRCQAPGSSFHNRRTAVLRTPTGQKAINNNTYNIIDGDRLISRTLSRDERRKVMAEDFGLVFTDEEWESIPERDFQ